MKEGTKMAKLSMPSVNISFTEKATQTIQRSTRGIVALILRGTTAEKNPIHITSVTDIPADFSEFNKEQVELSMLGYINTPKKVVVYMLAEEETSYNKALVRLAMEKINYLACPTISTDGQTQSVVTWVKTQRANGNKIIGVIPMSNADSEGIVNVTTEYFEKDGKRYTTEEYCSRIAGLIAGTPLNISCTYAPLNELTDCERLSREDMNAAIGNGEFIVFNDGEKVKVGRGINSFQTTTQDKGDQFKKIKIVETMDMIYTDIIKTTENDYLGKFANSYDNKCLLVGAIDSYFEVLALEGLVSSYNVEIDIEAQRNYIKSTGVDVSELSEEEIKEYNTGDSVFIKIQVKILDAIETITIKINI